MELYLNYDCDVYSTNVFEELCKLLSKVYFAILVCHRFEVVTTARNTNKENSTIWFSVIVIKGGSERNAIYWLLCSFVDCVSNSFQLLIVTVYRYVSRLVNVRSGRKKRKRHGESLFSLNNLSRMFFPKCVSFKCSFILF